MSTIGNFLNIFSFLLINDPVNFVNSGKPIARRVFTEIYPT
ncbi:hypothetical protein NSP_50960 [Nodularia spumigena CCY9414]|nr:hypothetical protein NSP_50960 [Nodularia spumigena CCY9414]